MKLLRYGPVGQEKPGLLDAEGNIRDLSGVISELDGPALSPTALAKLTEINPATLPQGDAISPSVAHLSQLIKHAKRSKPSDTLRRRLGSRRAADEG